MLRVEYSKEVKDRSNKFKIAGELKAQFSIFDGVPPITGGSKSEMEFSKKKSKDSVMITGVFKG